MLSFMGLYGVASPLPAYFSETIATEKEETLPLRDFLDIFNHRLYSFFYRAWKKYRYPLQFQRGGKDAFSSYMLSLIGLGTPELPNLVGVPSVKLLAYIGLMSQRPHSAEGLTRLLKNFWGIPVTILECVPRWVNIPEQARPRLGSKQEGIQPRLGTNVTVGEKILDFTGKFRVVLGPLSLEAFRRFLPGKNNAGVLRRLVRFYAPD